MIAALILVVGAGAAFSLIDSANRSRHSNSARVGAHEPRPRADGVRPRPPTTTCSSRPRSSPRCASTARIAGTLSGGTWTIERRGVTYTITTSVCTFDDPKDGLGVTAPPNACPTPAPVAGAPRGGQPRRLPARDLHDDVEDPRPRRQDLASALIVNPAGGLGPRITAFNEPATQITADRSQWGPTSPLARLKSTPAAAVHWTADDLSGGDARRRLDRAGASTGTSAPLQHDLAVGARRHATPSRPRRSTRAAFPARRRSSPSTSTATGPPVTGVDRRIQRVPQRRRHALGPLRRARPPGLPRHRACRRQADLPGDAATSRTG